jgi:hypothetical protein
MVDHKESDTHKLKVIEASGDFTECPVILL